MVEVPAVPMVTVALLVPLRVATEVVPLAKLTSREEVLVANRLKLASPTYFTGNASKVMVWSALFTLNDLLTSLAAL